MPAICIRPKVPVSPSLLMPACQLIIIHRPETLKTRTTVSTLRQVTAIAIGVVNPLGIDVSFTVKDIAFGHSGATSAADVNIDINGQLLSVNGTTTLPPGVFGSFNLKAIPTGEQPYFEWKGEKIPVVRWYCDC